MLFSVQMETTWIARALTDEGAKKRKQFGMLTSNFSVVY